MKGYIINDVKRYIVKISKSGVGSAGTAFLLIIYMHIALFFVEMQGVVWYNKL